MKSMTVMQPLLSPSTTAKMSSLSSLVYPGQHARLHCPALSGHTHNAHQVGLVDSDLMHNLRTLASTQQLHRTCALWDVNHAKASFCNAHRDWPCFVGRYAPAFESSATNSLISITPLPSSSCAQNTCFIWWTVKRIGNTCRCS